MKKAINHQSLAKYFFYSFVPAPATIFKGVKKPLVKHWQLDYSQKLELDREEIKQEVIRLLKKAVKKILKPTHTRFAPVLAGRQVQSLPRTGFGDGKKPIGVLLSGGIDSGLVAAMLKELLPTSSLHAFSLGFKEKDVDESFYARLVAKHLGIKHHLKIFSSKEALKVMPKIADCLEEPMADPSLLPTYFLFSLARKKVKVAFLGDGGDEAFAGYPKYLAHWFLEKIPLGKLPLAGLSRFFPGKMGTFLRYASFPLYLRNQLWISPFSPEEVKELTGQEVSFKDIERCHRLFNGQNPLDEAFFLDQKLTLPDLYLVKTERASQATTLAIHSPFLDKELFEFCTQIPFRLKLKNWQTKSLLKEIALDYLPKEVVLRPKKGFGIPLRKWLNDDLKSLVRKELSPRKIKKERLLNNQKVKETLRRGNPHKIWALLIFELWLKKWLKN